MGTSFGHGHGTQWVQYAPGSSYTPESTANLLAWYDATDTVTVDPAGLFTPKRLVVPSAGSTSVERWNDQTPGVTYQAGNIDFDTTKPTIVAAGQNGKQIVRFDGGDYLDTNDLSSAGALLGGVAVTIVLAFKLANTSQVTGLFGFNNSPRTTNEMLSVWINPSGGGTIGVSTSSDAATNTQRFTPALDTSWHVLVVRKPSGALNLMSVSLDGAMLTPSVTSTAVPNLTSGVGGRIGGPWSDNATFTNLCLADFGDVILYEADVGATEEAKLVAYERAKWGF